MSGDRPSQAATDAPFRLGEWRIDPALDQVSRGQEIVKLEPRTMRLLVRLAETPGRVVSARELLETVWAGVIVGPASVYQAISQLRKVLGDTDPNPTLIGTVPRKGYRLIVPVQPVAPAVDIPTPSRTRRPSARMVWSIATLLVTALVVVTFLATRQLEDPQTPGMPALAAALDSRAIVIAPFVPATDDEATHMLAPIVTDLVRTRMAALQNLVVIASGSITNAMQTEQDLDAVVRKVNARYLLRGELSRARDRVRINVTLVDVAAGDSLWSMAFERPVEQIATINREIVRRAAESLQIALEPATNAAAGDVPADLSTYQLYLRGQQLLSSFRAAEAEQATIVFSRVTTLDPSFWRGYYALGQALLLSVDLGARPMTEEVAKQADRVFDRVIELNPAFGPVWAQRARLTADPIQAEALYRRALQLAPSYDESYIRYSDFLFSQGRRGEALELIDRARRIDPLSAALCWRKAQLLLATRSDVAGMERMLNEALAIKPDFPTALRDLAKSKYLWRGDFAEAIRLMERAKAVDPDSHFADGLTVDVYLAMGDLPAALAVLRDAGPPASHAEREMSVSVPMYQQDIKRAADAARSVLRERLPPESNQKVIADELRVHAVHHELASWYWATANALRDEAIMTGDFASALDLIERMTAVFSGTSPMRNRGLVLTYAHMLLLAGETRRGRELLTSLLEHLDAEQIGRPANIFAWERSAIFAMLGENDRALAELAASQRMGRFAGWWYTAELDPVYSHLRDDPRFQALAERARLHSQQQRALLDEMRSNGEVPTRS